MENQPFPTVVELEASFQEAIEQPDEIIAYAEECYRLSKELDRLDYENQMAQSLVDTFQEALDQELYQ